MVPCLPKFNFYGDKSMKLITFDDNDKVDF